MKDNRAIATELEAAIIGECPSTTSSSVGCNYGNNFTILSNQAVTSLSESDLNSVKAGELSGTTCVQNGTYTTGGVTYLKLSFTHNSLTGVIYVNNGILQNPGRILPFIANDNIIFADTWTAGHMVELGSVVNWGNPLGCTTKTAALALGSSIYNASNYTNKQLVKYRDLFNASSKMYALTVIQPDHGVLKVNGSTLPVRHLMVGTSLSFTTACDSGYAIDYYKITYGDGTSGTSSQPGTSMPEMPMTLQVILKIKSTTTASAIITQQTGITIKVNSSTVSPQNIQVNSNVTLSYSLDANYAFTRWKITKADGTELNLGSSFKMPSYDIYVTAIVTYVAPSTISTSDFVILNIPNTGGARSLSITSNGAKHPNNSSPEYFSGIFPKEIEAMDNQPEHSDTLVNLYHMNSAVVDALCKQHYGDEFLQNCVSGVSVDFFISTTHSYYDTNGVTLNIFYENSASTFGTIESINLPRFSQTLSNTQDTTRSSISYDYKIINGGSHNKSGTFVALKIMPHQTCSISDLYNGNGGYPRAIIFHFDQPYGLLFQYTNTIEASANNPIEFIKHGSLLLNIEPIIYNVTQSALVEPYSDGTQANVGYLIHKILNPTNSDKVPYIGGNDFNMPAGDHGFHIRIKTPPGILENDQGSNWQEYLNSIYLTFGLVTLPLSDDPSNSDWGLNTATNTGSLFDTEWVDYVLSNYSGYIDENLTTTGLDAVPLSLLQQFLGASVSDFGIWLVVEETTDKSFIHIFIDLDQIVSVMGGADLQSIQSYDWQFDGPYTFYISLSFSGQIYAWTCNPYNDRNEVTIGESAFTSINTPIADLVTYANGMKSYWKPYLATDQLPECYVYICNV